MTQHIRTLPPGKLVRDNISERVKAKGETEVFLRLNLTEFREQSAYKVLEEAKELEEKVALKGRAGIMEESGDVFDIVQAFLDCRSLPMPAMSPTVSRGASISEEARMLISVAKAQDRRLILDRTANILKLVSMTWRPPHIAKYDVEKRRAEKARTHGLFRHRWYLVTGQSPVA